MSNNIYITRNKELIVLADTPFGQGGEGNVYDIITSTKYAGAHIAKIYHDKKLQKSRKDYEDRIQYMVNHPPHSIQGNTRSVEGFIWPVECLYDQKQNFAGFIMKKAEGIELKKLLTDANKARILEMDQVWQKFQLDEDSTLSNRAELCRNIAVAIYNIHKSNEYVIGDLKPDNIIVTPQGKVFIIDLDSCQISDRSNGKVLFESNMQTPLYSPPESGTPHKEQYWDLFIMGVIFYELFCNIHPFNSGTVSASYPEANKFAALTAKIKGGFFAHGAKRAHLEKILPPHSKFDALPPKIKELFVECFDVGHSTPYRRPSTNTWLNYLSARPKIISFKLNKIVPINGEELTLTWEVINADNVDIPSIPNQSSQLNPISGSHQIILRGDEKEFELIAKNVFGISTQKAFLKSFPTPIIESLNIPTPTFHISTNVSMPQPATVHWNTIPSVEKIFADTKYSTPKSIPFARKYKLNLTQAIQQLYDNIKSIVDGLK